MCRIWTYISMTIQHFLGATAGYMLVKADLLFKLQQITLSGIFRFFVVVIVVVVMVRLDFLGLCTRAPSSLTLCSFDCYFIILDYFDGINQFRRLSVYLVFDRSMRCGCGACSHCWCLQSVFFLDNAVSGIVSLHVCLSNLNLFMRSVLIGTFAICLLYIYLCYTILF